MNENEIVEMVVEFVRSTTKTQTDFDLKLQSKVGWLR